MKSSCYSLRAVIPTLKLTTFGVNPRSVGDFFHPTMYHHVIPPVVSRDRARLCSNVLVPAKLSTPSSNDDHLDDTPNPSTLMEAGRRLRIAHCGHDRRSLQRLKEMKRAILEDLRLCRLHVLLSSSYID